MKKVKLLQVEICEKVILRLKLLVFIDAFYAGEKSELFHLFISKNRFAI